MAAIAHLARNVDPGEILPHRRRLDRSGTVVLPLPSPSNNPRRYSRSYQPRRGIYAAYNCRNTRGQNANYEGAGMLTIGVPKVKALHGRPANSAIDLTRDDDK